MLREGTGMGDKDKTWAAGTVFLDALDIFGFENFRTNSFEQLCINFANEKLHQLYLLTMFKAEQDVIRLEKVEVPKVDYSDNEKCLHMLESAPMGMLVLGLGLGLGHLPATTHARERSHGHLPATRPLTPTRALSPAP